MLTQDPQMLLHQTQSYLDAKPWLKEYLIDLEKLKVNESQLENFLHTTTVPETERSLAKMYAVLGVKFSMATATADIIIGYGSEQFYTNTASPDLPGVLCATVVTVIGAATAVGNLNFLKKILGCSVNGIKHYLNSLKN